MIESKEEYYDFLKADSLANYRTSIKPKLFGDYIWKYIILLRRRQFFCFLKSQNNISNRILGNFLYKFNELRYKKLSLKLGYSIFTIDIGKGLGLPHYGTIVINSKTIIGDNCRIHQGVTIGSTSGSKDSAKIGNNVFFGSNATVIGKVTIADNVAVGAGAVVVKDISEAGTTWGGVPARKISNHDSHSQLPPMVRDQIHDHERISNE